MRRGSRRRTHSARWATTSSARATWAVPGQDPLRLVQQHLDHAVVAQGRVRARRDRGPRELTSSSGTSTADGSRTPPHRRPLLGPVAAPRARRAARRAHPLPARSCTSASSAVGFMQSHLGPMEAGPARLRCSCSRKSANSSRRRICSRARRPARVPRDGGIVVLIGTFLIFLAVPFGPDTVFADSRPASSSRSRCRRSRYSASHGGLVDHEQVLADGGPAGPRVSSIAYELPMVLAVIRVVIQAETLNMRQIVVDQNNGRRSSVGAVSVPVRPHASSSRSSCS